jgi:hypothetical protein
VSRNYDPGGGFRFNARWSATVSCTYAPAKYLLESETNPESAMSKVSAEGLTESEKAILLTLASLPAEFATDRVYFEKALFLLSRSGVDDLDDLADTFEAYDMGPYSPAADDTLLRMGDLKLVDKGTMSITDEGRRVATTLREDPSFRRVVEASDRLWEVLKGERFGRNDLLYLVYALYPEYAKASKLSLSERASSRLEHFTIGEKDVPEGGVTVFSSDKGNAIKVSRKDGRLELALAPR